MPAFAPLQGCANMSAADRLTADWAVMGEVDGQRDRPLSELDRYRRRCAEHGVVLDTRAHGEAVRGEGFDEPMGSELILRLGRPAR